MNSAIRSPWSGLRIAAGIVAFLLTALLLLLVCAQIHNGFNFLGLPIWRTAGHGGGD